MRWVWPSTAFPAPPRVGVDAPDGWQPADSPGSILTLREGDPEGGAAALVTVHVERQAISATAREVAGMLAERTAESAPDLVVLGDEDASIDGHPAVVRLQSFTPPDGQPVFQAQCIVVADSPAGTSDLVLVHATCTTDRATTCAPLFRRIVDSLTVTRPEGP